MTPVYKLSANSVKNGRTVYGSMLAGNTPYSLGVFESIATTTVGSGGASTVSFSAIPGTYSHLQIRYLARVSSGNLFYARFNSDSGSNYPYHRLSGNGSSASAYGTSATSKIDDIFLTTNSTDIFGAGVMDLLDYANTNKYKTLRSLSGYENNSAGQVILGSGLWMSTSAVTSIEFTPTTSLATFSQYSHFALYGIKGVA